MIKNEDILSILKQGEEDKTALLEDILLAVQKAETVFEAKSTDKLKPSDAAEDDIMNLLNGHIRRLETENTELGMEIEAAREAMEQIDGLKVRVAESESELEKTREEIANVMQEKNDANEKLVKIQAQWEKIAGG